MQKLIAVEGYGQVRMGSTFGNLAGVRIDAAGQVYRQNKCAVFMLTVHQRTGGKAGRTQTAMESGAVERIHDSGKWFMRKPGAVGANFHRQTVQALKICDGSGRLRLTPGQKDGHLPALFCGGAGDDKTVPAVVALSADHQQSAGMWELLLQFTRPFKRTSHYLSVW